MFFKYPTDVCYRSVCFSWIFKFALNTIAKRQIWELFGAECVGALHDGELLIEEFLWS